jgi:hypothetical protein
MYLPSQCKPIERGIVGQPSGHLRGNAGGDSANPAQGITPSGYGVEASGFNWGDIIQSLPGVISGIASLF